MFWRNWSWPARVLSVIFIGLIAAVLFPLFSRSPEPHRSGCQSNLKQIALGLLQYTQDYDEKMPLVAVRGSAYGWADVLQPYLKSTQILQCPNEPNLWQKDPRLTGYIDYWFNARLSNRELKTIDEPANLIAAGDGNDGTDLTNARYSIFALPPNWINDENSPSYRHLGTANYLFTDGHVKAIKPTAIVAKWSQTKPSFEPTKNAR